jgi:hypothetical protein
MTERLVECDLAGGCTSSSLRYRRDVNRAGIGAAMGAVSTVEARSLMGRLRQKSAGHERSFKERSQESSGVALGNLHEFFRRSTGDDVSAS